MDRPVSICGHGCICAAGKDTRACFETMLHGDVQPVFAPGFSYDQTMQSPVFAVPQEWIKRQEQNPPLTETMQLLFPVVDEALARAGLTADKLDNLKIGTCIGSSTGASLNFKSFYQKWREGNEPDLEVIESYLHCNPAAAVAEKYGFNGPVQTVTNACSSGTDAIGIAASWIRLGLCDLVIAGGADALSGISYTGFSRLMITSPQRCRPFDKDRQGLNLGEGAAVLILASESTMQELELNSIAQVMGYGTSCDAHHLTAPHPEGSGLKQAVRDALERSGISASEIGFINVHGTGTENNDRIEGQVINELFPTTPFTGTKGFTGHTLGAAGAVEAVMTVMSLQNGLLPPTSGFHEAAEGAKAIPVSKKTAIDAKYALSDSLAFGGNNSALVFKKGAA
ncbi:beta-ketoacyl-[acyl-carrier-protein] synthase family protein [Desulfovibrio sp. JC010]|uniref:beta-ketoacyl-[acyl-carrier-protein] synthase family protein n=1 Tax=Desulfovibrio sp. JC010 TaxID=2593641 RepID=UPI0013D8A2B3|nr:beta-ketoacyl-[acyl-carrier-protein] synthase family protein [Desulfovibrio sp. JC010]NDV26740.1 beta-ketoacyl-[acyl-carrier-protein] synthase family protein [Desulfovibrio sp. JC010]